MITLLARFKKNAGEFDKYDEFVEQYSKIVPKLPVNKYNLAPVSFLLQARD